MTRLPGLSKDDLKPGQKLCGRCGARGYGPWVVQFGQCFKCDGRGWTWKDKFREAFRADADGQFYGCTFAHPCGDQLIVTKSLATHRQLAADPWTRDQLDAPVIWGENSVFVRVTNEQARAFFLKALPDSRLDVFTLDASFWHPIRREAIRSRSVVNLMRVVIDAHPHVVRLPAQE